MSVHIVMNKMTSVTMATLKINKTNITINNINKEETPKILKDE